MPNQWYNNLSSQNIGYTPIKKIRGGWFVRDDTIPYQVLPSHQYFDFDLEKGGMYQLATVKGINPDSTDGKCRIPILPGYRIFTHYKDTYFQLSIGLDDETQCLKFICVDYGTDMTFTNVKNEFSQNNLFLSLQSYLNVKGKLSIPNILGFNEAENVQFLRNTVAKIYPNIFDDKIFKAQQKVEQLQRVIKRKSDSIGNIEDEKIISGLLVNPKGIDISPRKIQALFVDREQLKTKLYGANKSKKNLLTKFEEVKNQISEYEKSGVILPNNSDNDELLTSMDQKIDEMIVSSQLGSTMLINSKQYLSLILNQPCEKCGNKLYSSKDWDINTLGFTVKVSAICNICKAVSENTNETESVDFSKLVAAAGLVGGLNREELRTTLAFIGISRQSGRTAFFDYQSRFFEKINNSAEVSAMAALYAAIHDTKKENKNTLPVGFDASWSHVREANQASGELIYDGEIEGLVHKPVIGFHVAEKSRSIKRDGKMVTIHQGNHEQGSRQMEHAILIALIEKITPVLEEHDMMLDIAVDGDLETNKTLKILPVVHQIFADLKHLTKNIRNKLLNKQYIQWHAFEQHIMRYYRSCVYAATAKNKELEFTISEKDIQQLKIDDDMLRHVQIEGLVKHLTGDHSLCWDEVCWLKNNPDLELQEPTLITYSQKDCESFKKMLEKIFIFKKGQSLITSNRTCKNESFNRIKLNYHSKTTEFWKSFRTRHSLAVLHNNNGVLEMMNSVRNTGLLNSFSVQDIINIKKICKEREGQRQKNLQKINERNEKRAEDYEKKRMKLKGFDYDQDLVPYGQKSQEEMSVGEYRPFFAHLIYNFGAIVKCMGCYSFSKSFPNGLCKVCNFYLTNGFVGSIPNKGFSTKGKLSISSISPVQAVCENVFRYSELREGQLESVESFASGNDTFVLLPTGGGKTFCYVASALISNGITVVFSPLKALIQDQMVELLYFGIPCAGLFARTDQPLDYEKNIIKDIASGLIRIIFITPEKFHKNIGFRNMLTRLANERGIRFVIDEAHCVNDFQHFRESYGKFNELRQFFPSSPIMLLTATCSQEDAEKILHNLGLSVEMVKFVRSGSFLQNKISCEVRKKPMKKEDLVNNILDIVQSITTGKIIIYCLSPRSCNEIKEHLSSKISESIISVYHGELGGEKKHSTIIDWKNGIFKIMIATNAFGLGVNTPDVRAVIHWTFPLNISNLIQEIGRAGRDGLPAQSIIYYSARDFKALYSILAGQREINVNDTLERRNYLQTGLQKIHQVSFFCENKYECRKLLLSKIHCWSGDEITNECHDCDNCKQHEKDKPIHVDFQDDALRMIKIIEALLTIPELGLTKEIVVDVLCHANNKIMVEKKIIDLPIYQEIYAHKSKSKEEGIRILNDLIVRGIVKEKAVLERMGNGTSASFTLSVLIVGVIINAESEIESQEWNYLVKRGKQ